MKNLLILVFMSISLVSCIVEEETFSYTLFTNNSLHNITVCPYYNGVIDPELTFTLSPAETKKVSVTSHGGLGDGVCYDTSVSTCDSVLVLFDDSLSIVHYKLSFTGSAARFYPYSSLRNLYNIQSYIRNVINESRHSREVEFTYVFTENDYADLK